MPEAFTEDADKNPVPPESATRGKLTVLGWKITEQGKGTDLQLGDIVTYINGMPLAKGIEEAKKSMIAFSEYEGGIVVIDVLPVNAFTVSRRSFDRQPD